MLKTLHLSKKTIEEQSETIFKPVRNGESAVAMCYPGCKLDYNLSCYLADKKLLKRKLGRYYKRFVFISVVLDHDETYPTFLEKVKDSLIKKYRYKSGSDELTDLIKSIISEGKEVYLFILNAESVNTALLNKIARSLHNLIIQSNRVNGMLFFEVPIERPEIASVLQQNYKFLQNTLTFPLYNWEETLAIVNNLARSWGMKLTESNITAIVKNTGGHVWLLREMVRYLRDNPHQTVNDTLISLGIKMRTDTIYGMLSIDEKSALFSILDGRPSSLKNYFQSIGFINEHNHLNFPPLLPYTKLHSQAREFVVTERSITYGQQDITPLLTPLETKLLRFFIENKGVVVSREAVSEIIWEKKWEEKYSDWAIDRLIFRLRAKITEMGPDRTILKTLKSRGFIFGA